MLSTPFGKCVAGRLEECLPFFNMRGKITLQNSNDPGLDGMGVPTAHLSSQIITWHFCTKV